MFKLWQMIIVILALPFIILGFLGAFIIGGILAGVEAEKDFINLLDLGIK